MNQGGNRLQISGRISFRTDVAFVSGTGLKDSRLKERLSSLSGKNNQPPLPPGPRGLPVVGILPFFDPELYSCFESLSRTYGPIMRLPMGTKVGIVVSSPSAA
ncbi:unnamed protein product [Camellia sinensis]